MRGPGLIVISDNECSMGEAAGIDVTITFHPSPESSLRI